MQNESDKEIICRWLKLVMQIAKVSAVINRLGYNWSAYVFFCFFFN